MFLFKNLLRFSTLKLNQLGVEWNVNSFSCFSLDAINIDFCTAQNHALKHHVAHLISLWRARRVIQYILTLCCFYPCSSESFVTKESELFMRCRTKRREIWNLIPLNASLKRALTQHSSRLQRTIFWLIEGFQTCLASWIVTYFVKIFRLLTISAFSCIFFECYEIRIFDSTFQWKIFTFFPFHQSKYLLASVKHHIFFILTNLLIYSDRKYKKSRFLKVME